VKINYARLYNLGNYENERIEVEDEVGPDETPAEVLRRLAGWVATNAEELINERKAQRMAQRAQREPEF
jgi:hypothetical protein